MKRLIAFVITLIMPIILVAGGGSVIGWGITNEWEMVAWAGLAMVVVGLLWGLLLFLWAGNGAL